MSNEAPPEKATNGSAALAVRFRHLTNSQRIWLNRSKDDIANGRIEKAIKDINECLEILRLIEGMPPNEQAHTPRADED